MDGSKKGGIEMNDHEKTSFRGVAGRINDLAMDRSDLQFAVKELCRKMAKSENKDSDKASRNREVPEFSTPRSLGVPIRAVQKKLDGFADSDWAGASSSMKSKNLCCAEVEREWSSTQTTIA